MAGEITKADGRRLIDGLIKTIHDNREYLSDIDGAIGDGDHGVNMDKGFSMVEAELKGREVGFSEVLTVLGRTLIEEIGGSMGPLYGTFFKRMGRASKNASVMDAVLLESMLEAAYQGIQSLSEAQVGDKTLVDTLDPALEAVRKSVMAGKNLNEAVGAMLDGAETGWKSTEDMVARIGRASRLGERSRGALDAGATSCYLLLKSLGETVKGVSG